MARSVRLKAGVEVFELTWNEADAGLQFALDAGPGRAAEMVQTGRNRGYILSEGKVHAFVLFRSRKTTALWMDGRVHRLDAAPEAGSQAHLEASNGDVLAPMPGTVFKLLAVAGETVAAAQPIIIMESMKMELEVAAPFAGRVASVSCVAGQLVDMGMVLARVEAVDGAD